jgi:4-hydroxythreonine-4-phosphate dehydrogenase
VRTARRSALCTAPINKKALIDGAGFAFPGHTEFLAHLCRRRRGDDAGRAGLRVVPATIHIPLAAVPRALTPRLLERTLRLTHARR